MRDYRFTLWRTREQTLFADDNTTGAMPPKTYVNFICLNPSTATDDEDDPTVRKCQTLARLWDYENVLVTNIFAFRATDPKDMKRAFDPVGPENDYILRRRAQDAALVICAWGAHGVFKDRSRAIVDLLRSANIKLYYLRMGKHEPWHPLYLPNSTKPTHWE